MEGKTHKDLGQLRREYRLGRLEESQLPDDPMILLDAWMEQALKTASHDPSAMTLSTVDEQGNPSSRIVLLKKIVQGRLLFFTHYHSRKARDIQHNSRVAVNFHWPELERQVRITGTASPVEEAESDRYFQSRPFESQVAAWASPQSEVMPDRESLDNAYLSMLEKFKGALRVPRPPLWGGFAIHPLHLEFWQGGEHRLHDRIEYRLEEQGWSRVRLAP
jgi:pyridoxamine 5'-phosphate oxidase